MCITVWFQEEDEGNFVLTALLDAVEDANLTGIKELLDTANNFDPNQTNKVSQTVKASFHLTTTVFYI